MRLGRLKEEQHTPLPIPLREGRVELSLLGPSLGFKYERLACIIGSNRLEISHRVVTYNERT